MRKETLKGQRQCIVYSYGISTDTSFERSMIDSVGCKVFGFDPTVGWTNMSYGNYSRNFVFYKTALGAKSGSSPMFSLMEHIHDTMQRLNHSYIDILKVDVEGSEWEIFADMLSSLRLNPQISWFGQLLIELHYHTATQLDSFFRDMHSAGYVSFSREINLIPTLKGQLPLASEYSFINADLFFSRGRQSNLVVPRGSSDWREPINGVIYILTHRGRVSKLTETLTLLYQNVWEPFPHYPIIIFHDDLERNDKSTILRAVPLMDLKFIKIKFQIPSMFSNSSYKDKYNMKSKPLRIGDIPERTLCSALSSTIGYRHMIRFHAFQVHGYLSELKWPNGKEVEYIWRLDDDSYITHPVGYDVFRFMKVNNMKYGFVNIVQDDPLCIRGLWENARSFFADKILRKSDADNTSFFEELDEGAIFYNNFEVSSASLWNDPRWISYMEQVDATGNIYLERYADVTNCDTLGLSYI